MIVSSRDPRVRAFLHLVDAASDVPVMVFVRAIETRQMTRDELLADLRVLHRGFRAHDTLLRRAVILGLIMLVEYTSAEELPCSGCERARWREAN